VINGEAHPVNSSFITSDCSSQCTCNAGGVTSCMHLCSKMSLKCPPGTTLKEEDEPIGSGGVSCSCIRRYCVPAKGILVSLTSLFASTLSIRVPVSTALGIITISLPDFPRYEFLSVHSVISFVQGKLFSTGKLFSPSSWNRRCNTMMVTIGLD